MSFLDNALAGLIQIETAKAQNPRQVQTTQQFESDRRTSVDAASARAASSVAKPNVGFAGFDQRILIGTGVVLLGIVLFKVMK